MVTKIIAGIAVIGIVSFLIFKNDTDTSQSDTSVEVGTESNSSAEKVEKVEDFNEKTTLARLMEKGGNYQCTFSHTTQVGTSTGTVYISGKNIRGDFISKVAITGLPNIGDVDSSMMSDGESIYTWSSLSPEGYKTRVQQESSPTTGVSTNIPTNQELDYTCVGWKVDETKFSLPTNVTFKTL